MKTITKSVQGRHSNPSTSVATTFKAQMSLEREKKQSKPQTMYTMVLPCTYNPSRKWPSSVPGPIPSVSLLLPTTRDTTVQVCVCAYSASSLVLCGYNVQHWHILNMHHHTVQYRCTIQFNIDISKVKVHCTQSMYAYNNYTHLMLEAKDRCKVHT